MGEGLKRSIVTTEDGTVIIFDPELGQAVSGKDRAAAEAEIARRKEFRERVAA